MKSSKDKPGGKVITLNHNSNSKVKSDLTIYIYNVVEDEWSFISSLSTPDKQNQDITNAQNTADAFYLASCADNTDIYISPKNVSQNFQKYAQSVVGGKNPELLVPKAKTNLICLDIISDKYVLNYIVKKARNYNRITLTSYSASPQFYQLKDHLISLGLNVYTPEAPEVDSAWTVSFFGSKYGIRQLAQKSAVQEPDFVMSEGIICMGIFDAAKIAANRYIKQKGVVLKTNRGSGGSGILIFRENDLPNNYTDCELFLRNILSSEPYWSLHPIIIEDLIKINFAVGGGFPNVEFRIQKNGRIDMLYYCKSMVTPQGAFYGVDINDEVMNDRISVRIIDTGYYIAEQYSSAGYRGFFDIDYIAARNNIFVCESNTRNTGGTDTYKLTYRLFGKDFMKNIYVISRSHLPIPANRIPKLNEIIDHLSPLLFSKNKMEGVVINSENKLKQKELIYTVFAANKKRAYNIELELKKTIALFSK